MHKKVSQLTTLLQLLELLCNINTFILVHSSPSVNNSSQRILLQVLGLGRWFMQICFIAILFPNKYKSDAPIGDMEMQYDRLVKQLTQNPAINVTVIAKKANNYPDTIPRANIIRIKSYITSNSFAAAFRGGGIFPICLLEPSEKSGYCPRPFAGSDGFLAWFIKKLFKVQFFIKTASDEFRALAGNNIGFYLRFVKKFVLTCDRVQILNRGMLQYALHMGIPNHKLVFLPNGIQLDQYKFLEKSTLQLFTILFVGRLVRLKRIDTLLRALVVLKASGYNFQCYIIGEGDQFDYLVWSHRRFTFD